MYIDHFLNLNHFQNLDRDGKILTKSSSILSPYLIVRIINDVKT